jgi:hypothetical protein
MMGRYPQPIGKRGSLKWIQQYVNRCPDRLNDLIQSKLPGRPPISWCSPLLDDAFAEYRDAAFLKRIGAQELAAELEKFWPARGPQWDALARSEAGDVLLVEAKAHIGELCSPGSKAGLSSRPQIEAAFAEVARGLGAVPRAPWIDLFYQLANRLAHLYFMRMHGRKAWLVLANFVGDHDMQGPRTAAEWLAAYAVVWHVMGLPIRHRMSKFIIEIFPDVAELNG